MTFRILRTLYKSTTFLQMLPHALFENLRPVVAHVTPRITGCSCRISTAEEADKSNRSGIEITRYAPSLDSLFNAHSEFQWVSLFLGLDPEVLHDYVRPTIQNDRPLLEGTNQSAFEYAPSVHPQVIYELSTVADHIEPRLHVWGIPSPGTE